jgi:hypothetical protein
MLILQHRDLKIHGQITTNREISRLVVGGNFSDVSAEHGGGAA